MALSDNERKAYDRYEENTHYEASMHESHYGRGKLDGETTAIQKIAITMLNNNELIEKIILFTGLTQEAIENLKENL